MIKILLIEDNKFIVDIYERSFAAWNKTHNQNLYQVTSVFDGESGLQKALSEHFDIILLDILLPNKSGIDVLKELKSNPTTRLVPVSMLTNLGNDQIIDQAYQLGAVGYMVKANFTPDQIVDQVQNFLSDNSNHS